MKLLSIPGLKQILPYLGWGGDEIILFENGKAKIGHGKFHVEYYGSNFFEKYINYKNQIYFGSFRNEKKEESGSYRDGDYYYKDSDGRKLNLPCEVVEVLEYHFELGSPERLVCGNKMIGRVRSGKARSGVLAILDLDSNGIVFSPGLRLDPRSLTLCDMGVVGFNSATLELCFFDFDFNKQWGFKPDHNVAKKFVTGPIVEREIAVFSFGPKNPTRIEQGSKSGQQFETKDGVLYGFDLKSGNILWTVPFDNGVDCMCLSGSRVVVGSSEKIIVVDIDSGKIIKSIETGCEQKYNKNLFINDLFVHGEHILFCHKASAKLIVYRKMDLTLVRMIALPDRYTVEKLVFDKSLNGDLYFVLKLLDPDNIYYQNPLLVFNMMDDVENGLIERIIGPKIDVEIRKSESNSDEVEIWVELETTSIDEALFYGEIAAKNQAFYHGRQGTFLETLNSTDNFNGKVHLTCKIHIKDHADIERKVDFLRRSFVRWSDLFSHSCVDPTESATLDVRIC